MDTVCPACPETIRGLLRLEWIGSHYHTVLNAFDTRCSRCGHFFCAVCTYAPHFPSICTERRFWIERSAEIADTARYTTCVANLEDLQRRRTQLRNLDNGFMDSFVDHIYIDHPTSYVYEEMQRILNLCSWLQVTFCISPHLLPPLQENYDNLQDAFEQLFLRFPSHSWPIDMWDVSAQWREVAAAVASLLTAVRLARLGERRALAGTVECHYYWNMLSHAYLEEVAFWQSVVDDV